VKSRFLEKEIKNVNSLCHPPPLYVFPVLRESASYVILPLGTFYKTHIHGRPGEELELGEELENGEQPDHGVSREDPDVSVGWLLLPHNHSLEDVASL
jgi:hypothetical protein